MNLALHAIGRGAARFAGTALGVGLLFTVVLAMAGIYAGVVEDATTLARAMRADLWVVQQGTRGPFADSSRLDPSTERRIAAVPHVKTARAYSYQMIERPHGSRSLRFALVGLAWPDDRGGGLPLVAGRELHQAHGELLADDSLGLAIGETLLLADEIHRVVGLLRGAVNFGGDGILFSTVADAAAIAGELPPDALRAERARTLERLRGTDPGRSSPALEDLALDPRWSHPGVADPPLAAVLVTVDSPANATGVASILGAWPDVSVHSQAAQEGFLVHGVVERARMQLGIFAVLLTVTSALIVGLILYTRTVERTHDIAVLKLMGMPTLRLAGMVVSESWLLGALAYVTALLIGDAAFPHFARRIVLTPVIHAVGPVLALLVATLASVAGVRYALRVDVAKVLEG